MEKKKKIRLIVLGVVGAAAIIAVGYNIFAGGRRAGTPATSGTSAPVSDAELEQQRGSARSAPGQ